MIRQCWNWPGSLSDRVTVVEFYCWLFKVLGVTETLSEKKKSYVLLSVGFMF